MKRIITVILAALLVLISVAGCGSGDQSELTKVVVAYGENLGGASTVATAVEKGFFKEEGLDVELLGFPAMPAAISAMVSGDIDFVFIGHGAHALCANGQATIIALDQLSVAETIIARGDRQIESVKDLKGKTVATQFGTSGEVILNLALEKAGLTSSDVDIVGMDMAGCATAILAGQVDAVSVYAPTTITVLKGLGDNQKIIGTTADFLDKMIFPASWCTLPSTISEKPELTHSFVRALAKAFQYRHDNPDECIGFAAKLLNQDTDTLMECKNEQIWMTLEDMMTKAQDGTYDKWYQIQQDSFIEAGRVEGKVPLENYVDTSSFVKACEEILK